MILEVLPGGDLFPALPNEDSAPLGKRREGIGVLRGKVNIHLVEGLSAETL